MIAANALRSIRARLRGHAGADAGVTLVELSVAIFLFGIVSTMFFTAFAVTGRTFTRVDDESTGLADVRKVSERLGRDIRNARGVDAGATASKLVLWIDSNSDYRRSADESVTWELRTIAGDAEHFDVIRKQGTATEVIEARSLVSEIAFEYDLPAPATQVVATTLNYDAFAGTGAAQRTLYFAERLRNAGEA
jgi:prepilin-type N-terminal cleavage/methylation domain-containing protein